MKLYGTEPAGEARYSPPKCVGTRMEVQSGDPDPAHVSTSYAERQNLNMRMGMRRFTRLTTAFSKTCENHEHMLSIYYAYLQLRPGASDPQDHARHGGRNRASRLDD